MNKLSYKHKLFNPIRAIADSETGFRPGSPARRWCRETCGGDRARWRRRHQIRNSSHFRH